MDYSAGIIPFRRNEVGNIEFFIGHPGGTSDNYWAYLKGGVMKNETPFEAAIREFKEESGVSLEDIPEAFFIPLGSSQQNKHKVVIAFGVEYGEINPEECFSNLCENGVTPEVDRYAWMTFDELSPITHKKHLDFYRQIIDEVNH